MYYEDFVKIYLETAKLKNAIPSTEDLTTKTRSVGWWSSQLNDIVFIVMLLREVKKTINRKSSKIESDDHNDRLRLYVDIRDFCYAQILTSCKVELDEIVIRDLRNELQLIKENGFMDLNENDSLQNTIDRSIKFCSILLKRKYKKSINNNNNKIDQVFKNKSYFKTKNSS
ncbi:MAG TPA: hypothetical protein PKE39_02705 [Ignavibacteria bacterium]|nr:hypothetical protein [Ignavibacteria bacterium]